MSERFSKKAVVAELVRRMDAIETQYKSLTGRTIDHDGGTDQTRVKHWSELGRKHATPDAEREACDLYGRWRALRRFCFDVRNGDVPTVTP